MTTQNKWKEVWERREAQDTNSTLQTLIYLDGFDSGAGKIKAADWRSYTDSLMEQLSIQPVHSVYEIGCGSGAFLYPFYMKGITVGGLDYSATQIAYAKQYMPEAADLTESEANAVLSEPPYDFVFSNAVFHYFPDEVYATEVLTKMLAKAKKAILISEVPDSALKNEAEAERRSSLSPHEYDRKYKDLSHLYLSRSFFEDFAKQKGCTVEINSQSIKNYTQNSYRFNCLIAKE